MIEFKILVSDMAVRRKLKAALRTFDDLREEMRKVGEYVVKDGRKRLRERGSRTSIGRLGRSLVAHPFKRAVVISSSRPYARIQQEGGTVRSARPGGYLAIPLRLKEARSHAWPRHWKSDKLFPIRTKTGLYLVTEEQQHIGTGKFRKNKKGERVERKKKWGFRFVFVYKLVKQARIPGRPYLVKSRKLVDYMQGLIVRRWERWRAGGGV